MSRRLPFLARLTPPVEPLPVRSASLAIVLIVVGSWAVCVGSAWVIAAGVRLAAGVFA